MHILIAIVLLFGVYAVAGEESFSDGAQVSQVSVGGPAQSAGVEPGDVVVAVDGVAIQSPTELGEQIRTNQPADVVTLSVVRDDQPIDLTLGTRRQRRRRRARRHHQRCRSSRPSTTRSRLLPANAVTDVFPFAWESTKGVVKVLNPVNIVGHVTGGNDDLSSRPTTLYGVAQISDDVGESSGWAGIILLLAVLNVFVGVFNMFPLLPLDGGHAAIATYERVREAHARRHAALLRRRRTPDAVRDGRDHRAG